MFGGRFGLRVAVVEQLGPGGQIINATQIDNMPGFAHGIAGIELGPLVHAQADAAGAEFILDTVEGRPRSMGGSASLRVRPNRCAPPR